MWIKYVIMVLITIDILGKIALIDDERPPITKGGAIFNAVFGGLLIAGIIYYWK